MIKRSIQEEDITIVNIYAPNIGPPKYIKHTDIREKLTVNNSRGLLISHLHQWADHPDRK